MKKMTSSKNLMTGMTHMEIKNSLTAADVCSIIEASATAGLSSLKFGELEISFLQKLGQVQTSTVGYIQPIDAAEIKQSGLPPILPHSPYGGLSKEEHEKRTKDQIEAEELNAKADYLAELLITDPLKYEQLLSQGELSDPTANNDGVEDSE